jgi:hypothetical protein
MKSLHGHIEQNHLPPASYLPCLRRRFVAAHLIADRSMPRSSGMTSYACCTLTGPPIWRWRKYTVFPRKAGRGKKTILAEQGVP